MAKDMKLTIGEFSNFCQVTVKTLRHYEKLGLLVPNAVDEWTRYRYYDVAQLLQLNDILRLRNLGFTLDEIRELQDEGSHRPSIPQIEEKIRFVERQIELLTDKLGGLKRLVESMERVNSMERISIQSLPEIAVASHRRVLRRREDLAPLFDNIINPELQRIGCKRTLPIYGFKIEHEQEFKVENIDTEYCLQVDALEKDTPLIKFKTLPAIPTAVCFKHIGPYTNLHEHLTELLHYIADHGYKVCGPYRWQYVEGRHNQKNPKKWITIIQVPVTELTSF